MASRSNSVYRPVQSINGQVQGFRMNDHSNPYMKGSYLWLWVTMALLMISLLIILLLWLSGTFDQFYLIGGTVIDLPANRDIRLTLFIDGVQEEQLDIITNGTFNFNTKYRKGSTYQVNTLMDDDLVAIVRNATGTIESHAVENIMVEIVDTLTSSALRVAQIQIEGGRQPQQ